MERGARGDRGGDPPLPHRAASPGDEDDRRARCGSRPTRQPLIRRAARRCSRPAALSKRSSAAASRSSGRPATTHLPARRWAFASSTTSRSRRVTPSPSSVSGASPSSTGTCTTATGHKTSSGDDDSVLFVSLHEWPFYPGSGGPTRPGGHDAQHPDVGGLGRRGVPPRVRPRGRCPRSSGSGRTCSSCPQGSTHTWTTPWPTSR